jgi:hypothetical protein
MRCVGTVVVSDVSDEQERRTSSIAIGVHCMFDLHVLNA